MIEQWKLIWYGDGDGVGVGDVDVGNGALLAHSH